MRSKWIWVLLPGTALTLALAACTTAPRAVPGLPVSNRHPLQGQIRVPDRAIAALISDVANGATLSLIDSVTGATLATTVSTPEGTYALYLPAGFTPVPGRPYVLEALKGLPTGGSANRAGASLARLRTILFYQNSDWVSLTSATPGDRIDIGWATTALAVISNLRALSAPDQQGLMGKVNSAGTSFSALGTAVSSSEFSAVFALVDRTLKSDQDPVEVVGYDPTGATPATQYGRKPSDLVIYPALSPAAPVPGGTVTVAGQGFPAPRADVRVSVGTQPVAWTVSADRRQLTLSLPTGAFSGLLAITQGSSTWTGPFIPVGTATQRLSLDYEDGSVTGWTNNTTQSGGTGTVTNAAGGPTGRYMSNSVPEIIANYPSTTAYGVWEYDTIRKGYHEFWPVQNNTSTWMSSGEGYLLWYYNDGWLRFSKVTGGVTTHLGEYRSLIPDGTWVHYRMERTASGVWRIFENNALVIQATDNALTTSSYIGTYYWGVPAGTGGLDNVKVSSW